MLRKYFLIIFFALTVVVSGQNPTCPSPFIYLQTGLTIMAYNTSLPISSTNPFSTGIPSPPGNGLTLMPNISGGTLSPTFYSTGGGSYHYWSGASWVNTTISTGSGGVNLGGCSNAIYSILGSTVYVYSTNTGSTSFVTNLNPLPNVADLVPDCNCNFYIFSNGPKLVKYSPTGTMLATYTLTGLPGAVSGGGYAIVGNNVYCVSSSSMHVGSITSGSIINFTALSGTITAGSDWASCPVDLNALPVTGTINVNASSCQTGTIMASSNSAVTYSWSGPGITSPVTTSAVVTNSTGVYTCTIFSSGCGTPPTLSLTSAMGNNTCITVSSNSITCANLGSATVAPIGGIGPFSYTWMPSGQTSSVASGLSPGVYTINIFDFGNNFTYTATTVFTSLIPLTGTLNYAGSVTCNGASTATANVTNIAGGSGTENYLWISNTATYTSPTPTLSAGIWSISVTDGLTGCQINQSFFISQPPPLNLVLSSTSPSTCAGTSVTLSGVNSGGTPYLLGSGYTYTWTGGVQNNTRTVSQAVAGTPVYTLSSRDSLNCLTSQTIAVDFIQNPVLSVSHVSICPLQTATLSVSGATSYTWTSTSLSLTGSTFTDNPMASQQYSVTGSALGCTSIATASIILKPVPFALLSSNSPICNAQNLNLFANGGVSYFWNGPLGYSSSQQYPVIAGANPNNSGVYNVTVTAANSCTASTNGTVVVNPTPTLSASGSTVCVTQTLNLFSNSFTGASYLWSGPNSFTANVQNPSVVSPPVSASGSYTVKVTSAVGCTNTATADVTVTALPVPTITSNSPKCFGTTLNLIGGGGDAYLWNGPNGFNSAVQNPFITTVGLADAGVYGLQVTRGPCVNTTTHVVVINPLPNFTLSSNSPVCETKSLTLSASTVSNAVSYLWHPSPGTGFTGSQFQNTGRDSSKIHYSGIYALTVIDANGCQNSSSLAVNVFTNPVLSPVSTTVCFNNEATLKVSGADTYTWTGPEFYYSNSANALINSATSVVPTIYTVTGRAANSCTSITTASISTTPLPNPWLSVYPATKVCLNKEISLEGFGARSYEWKGPNNFNYGHKVFTFTVNSLAYVGTYTLVATDSLGCSNFTHTSISYDPLPDGTLLGTIMDACVPFESDFSYYSSSNTSTNIATEWQINNEAIIQGKTFSRPFTLAGDYFIRGTFIDTISTCANTASFVVHAREIPVADFVSSPEKPVEGFDEVFFTNTSKGIELNEWNWFFIDNKGMISKQQNTSYYFKDAGSYPVALLVKNKWGCADTVVKAIQVEPDFNVYVPNVFTPNDDNDNQVFLPVCTGVKFYELNVFNRWGTKVFQSIDLSHGWDGTLNGQPCKNDVYVWQINISSQSGEMKTLSGHVTLYR